MGTQGGRNDEELRREHEEGHPDYARGQDDGEEIHTDHPDFARGQRQDQTYREEGDFAEGQEGPEHHVAHDEGDFARGQRRGDPDRG